MKTIAHYIPEKNYIGILNSLNQIKTITLANLHDNIFDYIYIHKPDNLILPIHEYTQEFHSFVENNKNKLNIILYCGQVQPQQELKQFLQHADIKIICQKQKPEADNELFYENIYDSTIFINNKEERINKILVILSQDNDKNQKMLDHELYPNKKLPICLINNPDYQHPQNIGVAYQVELAKMFNTYASLIDIDQEFDLEAQACGIPNLMYNTSIESTIKDPIIKPEAENLERYESNYFVSKILIPSMKG